MQSVWPETAVVSVGGNCCGTPAPETLGCLTETGSRMYRTDLQDHILLAVHEGD